MPRLISHRPAYSTTISLTGSELELLKEALDSHEYWTLTEGSDRNDGASQVKDGASKEIDACRALLKKIERAARRCKDTTEEIAAIETGRADFVAGCTKSLDQVRAEIRAVREEGE